MALAFFKCSKLVRDRTVRLFSCNGCGDLGGGIKALLASLKARVRLGTDAEAACCEFFEERNDPAAAELGDRLFFAGGGLTGAMG